MTEMTPEIQEVQEFANAVPKQPSWVQKVGEWVLKAVFKLDPKDPEAIAFAIEQILDQSNPAIAESSEAYTNALYLLTNPASQSWAKDIPHIKENLVNIERFVEDNPHVALEVVRIQEGLLQNIIAGIKAEPGKVLKTLGSALLPILLSVLASTLLGPAGSMAVMGGLTLRRVLKAVGGAKKAAVIASEASSRAVQNQTAEIAVDLETNVQPLVPQKVSKEWRNVIFGAPQSQKYADYIKQNANNTSVVQYISYVLRLIKWDLAHASSALTNKIQQVYNATLQWYSAQPYLALQENTMKNIGIKIPELALLLEASGQANLNTATMEYVNDLAAFLNKMAPDAGIIQTSTTNGVTRSYSNFNYSAGKIGDIDLANVGGEGEATVYALDDGRLIQLPEYLTSRNAYVSARNTYPNVDFADSEIVAQQTEYDVPGINAVDNMEAYNNWKIEQNTVVEEDPKEAPKEQVTEEPINQAIAEPVDKAVEEPVVDDLAVEEPVVDKTIEEPIVDDSVAEDFDPFSGDDDPDSSEPINIPAPAIEDTSIEEQPVIDNTTVEEPIEDSSFTDIPDDPELPSIAPEIGDMDLEDLTPEDIVASTDPVSALVGTVLKVLGVAAAVGGTAAAVGAVSNANKEKNRNVVEGELAPKTYGTMMTKILQAMAAEKDPNRRNQLLKGTLKKADIAYKSGLDTKWKPVKSWTDIEDSAYALQTPNGITAVARSGDING